MFKKQEPKEHIYRIQYSDATYIRANSQEDAISAFINEVESSNLTPNCPKIDCVETYANLPIPSNVWFMSTANSKATVITDSGVSYTYDPNQ